MAAYDSDHPKRIRWRCRRGTKELDALYGWWFEACWPDAAADARRAFDELLDQPDPDLWDWTIGHGVPPRADWKAIVDAIRTHHQL